MSLARAVAWNTAVQVGGRAVGLLASMALTALLTRHLGLATYGQYVAAATYVSLFTVLGDAGLYLVTVRRAAQEVERRSAILGNALGLRLLLALVTLALAVVVAQFIPTARFPTYVPAVKAAVCVLALNAYITLQSQFLIAVFRLHLRMDLAVVGEVLARVVTLGCVGLAIAFGGGLLAVVIAISAGTAANFVYAWIVGRRFETFRPQFDVQLWRELMAESAVLAVVTMLGLIHFKVDTLMLSILQPPQDVGIYGVAYKVHEVLITFPGLFVGLLFPVFSRLASENPQRLRRVFQRAFDVLLLSAVGAALLVYVLAPAMSSILGAPQAASPMRILVFALPPVFVGLGFTHLLLAEGRQRGLVALYAFLVVVNVGCNWVFIQRYSYRGAAAVTVATESLSVVCLCGYWLGRRRWKLELRSLWGVPLAIGLGAALDAAASRWMPVAGRGVTAQVLGMAIGACVALALYLGAVLGLRLLPPAAVRALLPGGRPAADDTLAPEPRP